MSVNPHEGESAPSGVPPTWVTSTDVDNPTCVEFRLTTQTNARIQTQVAGNRIRLMQGEDTILLAAGGAQYWGLLTLFVRPFVFIPPLSSAECNRTREAHPQEADWWTAWAIRFATSLSKSGLDGSRTWRLDRALITSDRFQTPRRQVPRRNFPSVVFVDDEPPEDPDFPIQEIDWSISGENSYLPMRQLGTGDLGRLKALRKLAVTNELPPLLLWWHTGMQRHLVLDGHVRLAAFREAGTSIKALVLSEQRPWKNAALIEAANLKRAEEVQRVINDPSVRAKVTAELFAAHPYSQYTTTARPLPGHVESWDREAHLLSPEFLSRVHQHLEPALPKPQRLSSHQTNN